VLWGLLLAAGGLYYLTAGLEDDAALIPDSVEGKIGLMVERLNQKLCSYSILAIIS
jgi:hypothetical protein